MSKEQPPFLEHFPLRKVPSDLRERLYRSLLGWLDCALCSNQGCCRGNKCRWSQKPPLASYIQYYQKITALSTPDDWSNPNQALNTHDDLLSIIHLINTKGTTSRELLLKQYFAVPGREQTPLVDQGRAFDLAFAAISMIPCSESNHLLNVLQPLSLPVTWNKRQSARGLVENAIQRGPTINPSVLPSLIFQLSASRLEHCNMRLVGTDDFRKHLFLNETSRVVYVFHHVEFLRAKLSTNGHDTISSSEVIDRQLVLETIYSIYFILFRSDDLRSCEIAARIGCNLDELERDRLSCFQEAEEELQHQYWSTRMQTLSGEVNKVMNARSWWLVARDWGHTHLLIILMAMGIIVPMVIGIADVIYGAGAKK